jgi:hypothetical protein
MPPAFSGRCDAGPEASMPPTGRGDQSKRQHSRQVLVLVAHGNGHEEHDTQVRGVRGEIEIKEQSVRERGARRCEQE